MAGVSQLLESHGQVHAICQLSNLNTYCRGKAISLAVGLSIILKALCFLNFLFKSEL